MAANNYSNIAVETALSSGISGGDLSLVVLDASGWPATPFVLVIDPDIAGEELILVGGKSGTTFSSLTRGYGGTSAVAHNAAAVIKHVVPAEDHRLIWEHVHSGAAGDNTALVSHDNLSGVSADDHHTQAHTVASHSDTDATGAELETLTNGSDADALHTHPAALAAHVASADEHPGYVLNAELSTHEGAADPHAGYIKETDLGSFIEFGGATENVLDASVPVDPTFDAGATATFTKPAAWNTYKIMAWGTVHGGYRTVSGQNISVKVSIGGNDGTVVQGPSNFEATASAGTASARHERSGLTGNTDVIVHYAEHQASEEFQKLSSIVNFIAFRTS